MIQIYHHARCGTSRKGLEIVKNSGEEFEIIEYMKSPISLTELKELVRKLGIKPIELVRQKEVVWKEKYLGRTLTDEQIIVAMQQHPELLQRPIVVKNGKAVIGRPPELIKDLF